MHPQLRVPGRDHPGTGCSIACGGFRRDPERYVLEKIDFTQQLREFGIQVKRRRSEAKPEGESRDNDKG